MNSLLMIGGGGHAISCLEVINMMGLYKVDKILSNSNTHASINHMVDNEGSLKKLRKSYDHAFIGVGQIKDAKPRQRLFTELKEYGFNLPVIISPKSHISCDSNIGEGTIVMNFCLLNAHSIVGDNCIVNNFALIEHSACIGNNVHVSTGVRVNGEAQIEDGCFIGSGAVISNGIKIGKNSIVSANSFVYKDLAENTKFK